MEAALRKSAAVRQAPPPVAVAHPVASAVTPGRVQCLDVTRVSSPSDPAEREAESTAKRVVRMGEPGMVSPYVSRFSGAMRRTIARRGDGAPRVRSETAQGISASLSSGAPLPDAVRGFMEPRFRADFSGVRIHTGDRPAALNRQLNAQAFTVGQHVFFGKDRFRPDHSDGRELIAHELTHTIQQGGAVQRAEAPAVTAHTTPHVQRLGLSDALDFFADKANLLPGFRMFTIVLGVNPVNMSRVERSPANIMRAVVEFMPGGGLITRALDTYGVFDRAGAWVAQQIEILGMTGSVIKRAVDAFVSSLGVSDLFNLGGVWDRAKRIFTEPIERIIALVKQLVTGILKFIREAILRPLAAAAQNTRGYDLLKAVIGQDPVTGDAYPRNAETLIGGFMKLVGQDEVWENIKKSNAIARAWAWFQGALASLVSFARTLPSLIVQTLQSLEIADLILIPRAWLKVATALGGFVLRFVTWAGGAVWTLLEIIFDVVAPGLVGYIKKAGTAFRTILQNPIRFVGHLVKAAGLGFQQFAERIGFHLKKSLIEWLTGTLSGIDVYIPKAFEIKEFIKFVLSLLGLTWQNIRTKLVKAVGETAVKALETGFDIVKTLVAEGPAAAWEKIKEQLTNLKEIVFEEISKFVIVKIVQSAVTKIIGMLFPAAAIIEAIVATYNTVMFFVERMRQMIKVVAAFIDSLAAIASGAIASAANKVEETLGGLLTLAISFMARLIGLGKVSDVVTNIITKVRAPIDKGLDKVVEWIVAGAKKLGKLAVGAAQKAFNWAFGTSTFIGEDKKKHSIYVDTSKGQPTLTIASTPAPAKQFLDWYLGEKGATFTAENGDKIAAAEAAIKAANVAVAEVETARAANKDAATVDALLRKVLDANVAVSQALTNLIRSDRSIGKAREKYKLEGLIGTYGSMPKPPGDDFTADHQPQFAILEAAVELGCFDPGSPMVNRAAGRAKLGYAINLYKRRHEAGATFGSKGAQTKDSFKKAVGPMIAGQPKDVARRLVVAQIGSDLKRDVAAMKAVASPSSKYWTDIEPFGEADSKPLIAEVSARIVAGEDQLAAQDLDSLAK